MAPCAAWAVKYCGLGLKVEELIESTANQVTVQFMSGAHHSGHGFYLSYSTTEHSGNTHMRTMPLKLVKKKKNKKKNTDFFFLCFTAEMLLPGQPVS